MIAKALAAVVVCAGLLVPATPAHADPVGGRQVANETVKANSTDVYTVTLRGSEITRVRLSGDGDTCLELRIYDENGNLVASDTLGLGDDRKAFVTPKWTGKFTVKVRNIGGVYNRYTLVMD